MKNQEITKNIENKVETAMSKEIEARIEAAMAGAKYASRCEIYLSHKRYSELYFLFRDENENLIFCDAAVGVQSFDDALYNAEKWCINICEGKLPVDENGVVKWGVYTIVKDWEHTAEEVYNDVITGDAESISFRDVVAYYMKRQVINEIKERFYKAESVYYDVISKYYLYIAHDKEEDSVLIIYKDEYKNILGGDRFYFIDCNDGYFDRCLPDIVHRLYLSLLCGAYGIDAADAKEEYDAVFDEIGRVKNDKYERMLDCEIPNFIGIEYLPEID